jgi:hypothetical protein
MFVLFRDLSGADQYLYETTMQYENAKGIIIAYDLSAPQNFDNIKRWHSKLYDVIFFFTRGKVQFILFLYFELKVWNR